MAVLEVATSVAAKAVASVAEGMQKGVERIKNLSNEEMKEIAKQKIENIKSSGDAVMSKLDEIKNFTPEQLQEKMNEGIDEQNFENTSEADEVEKKSEGLTDEEKVTIKKETGWSDEIIGAIDSKEEYEIYKKAGLSDAEINGNKCLIRNDIDWDQKDAMGRTNRERAEQGLSPINKDGKVIELHHIGQHSDSPLAELTTEEHRGKGNDTILHNKIKESEINRQAFAKERNNHWEARTYEGGNHQ